LLMYIKIGVESLYGLMSYTLAILSFTRPKLILSKRRYGSLNLISVVHQTNWVPELDLPFDNFSP
jgi:hypothetical protein